VRALWQKWAEKRFIGTRAYYERQLSEFITRIHDVANLEELGSELISLIANFLDCKRAFLLLPQVEEEGFGTRFIYPTAEGNPMGELKLRLDSPIVNWLERDDAILQERKLDILPEFLSMWTQEREEIQSAEIKMLLPLMNRKTHIAILATSERRDGNLYPVEDLDYLESISDRLAVSIAKEFALEQLEEKSRIDVLTGLFNRRHFEERFKEEISRHSRYDDAFSILMLDLDKFKAYNDTQGHPAGDKLLGQIGKIINGSIRDADQAFRYGGDEFVIILPRTTVEAAYVVAERVRVQIAREMETQGIAVTISIGLANCPTDGVVDEALVDVADDALLHAKQAGGNRTLGSSSIFSKPLDEGGMHGT